MTKTLDHAAEAVIYSNLAYDNRTNPTYEGYADLAQLHATLALVEQQRTANRIAYLAMVTATINAGKATEVDEAGLSALADAAYGGLGL